MGAKRDYPRYNHVQTIMADADYDAMREFAKTHSISHSKAAEVLIVAALKLLGVK